MALYCVYTSSWHHTSLHFLLVTSKQQYITSRISATRNTTIKLHMLSPGNARKICKHYSSDGDCTTALFLFGPCLAPRAVVLRKVLMAEDKLYLRRKSVFSDRLFDRREESRLPSSVQYFFSSRLIFLWDLRFSLLFLPSITTERLAFRKIPGLTFLSYAETSFFIFYTFSLAVQTSLSIKKTKTKIKTKPKNKLLSHSFSCQEGHQSCWHVMVTPWLTSKMHEPTGECWRWKSRGQACFMQNVTCISNTLVPKWSHMHSGRKRAELARADLMCIYFIVWLTAANTQGRRQLKMKNTGNVLLSRVLAGVTLWETNTERTKNKTPTITNQINKQKNKNKQQPPPPKKKRRTTTKRKEKEKQTQNERLRVTVRSSSCRGYPLHL